MSAADPLRTLADRLEDAGVPTPMVDARLLVEHVTQLAGDPRGCAPAADLLERLAARRVAREPLQLIIGRTWFRTLELACAPGVFVPRPETEIVAGLAIAAARAAVAASPDAHARVVDACTGGGAIAASLLAEVSGVEVVATDLDPGAVALATRNLERVRDGRAGAPAAPGSTARVVVGDLLAGVDDRWRGHLDVLVANPPYLPAADRSTWEPEVAAHDPDTALVGGEHGHEVVDRLLELAAGWLAPGGTVVVEIDQRRGSEARARAQDAGLVDVEVVVDLTGGDRAVMGRAPASSR